MAQISKLETDGVLLLKISEQEIEIASEDVEISSDDIPGLLVASKGSLTTALDITVTPELEQEGLAREFVNRIQKIRKDSNFELTDRIEVIVQDSDLLMTALNTYNTYICTEILADKISFSAEMLDGIDIDVNEHPIKVFVTKK